jgi:hypothetical protein
MGDQAELPRPALIMPLGGADDELPTCTGECEEEISTVVLLLSAFFGDSNATDLFVMLFFTLDFNFIFFTCNDDDDDDDDDNDDEDDDDPCAGKLEEGSASTNSSSLSARGYPKSSFSRSVLEKIAFLALPMARCSPR